MSEQDSPVVSVQFGEGLLLLVQPSVPDSWLVTVLAQDGIYINTLSKTDRKTQFPTTPSLSSLLTNIPSTTIGFTSSPPSLSITTLLPTALSLTPVSDTDLYPTARTALHALATQLQTTRNEVDALKRMAARAAVVPVVGGGQAGLVKRGPVKRAAVAKSLVNPRQKMRVAKGTEFGSDSDSSD
ncbi:hypothetical protein HKX48_007264 [Thoreauomyces humboldtii]|nr:hypothetical protein HKX48_007264 [Thoreauomyces humboldtii]